MKVRNTATCEPDISLTPSVFSNPPSVNQEQVVAQPEPEPGRAPAPETQLPAVSPPVPEEADLTWEDKEDKEDKLDAENIEPDSPSPNATDKKYQYKEGGSLLYVVLDVCVITFICTSPSLSYSLSFVEFVQQENTFSKNSLHSFFFRTMETN